MEKIKLRAELDQAALNHMILKYHFGEDDRELIFSIHNAMKSLVCPSLYIKLGKDEDRLRMSGIQYERYALVLITLGIMVDELEELYGRAEALKNAFIVECLSMEILKKAYEAMEEVVVKKWALYPGEYAFPGDRLPLEYIKDLFCLVPQKEITYNSALAFKPSKSGAFVIELKNTPGRKKCGICDNCGNLNCSYGNSKKSNHKNKENKNTHSGRNEGITLNYGFQRIFGRERED